MIALDVMGGDHAPEQIVIGALNAAKKSIPLILVGPQEVVKELLYKYDLNWQNYPITLCDSASVIAMDEDPVNAVRQKKDSSIVKIIELVKTGQANVAISAGNSGAVMVAASLILGRIDKLDRPAIAGLLPTSTGKKVLALDLGANTECRPNNLVQFAYLADDYAKNILDIPNPRIALLSNGQEDCKGSLVTKEAFLLLKNSKLNFIGNIEPFDIFDHKTDIVVSDGFSGNIFLKTLEGAFELLAKLVKKDAERKKIFDSKICDFVYDTAKSVLYSGGAVLLGVKGNIIICHGNSTAEVIENTIENSVKFFNMK
ncbi:MAG: phosphate acyltransferase PlsX [Candidatus Babeliales bacterium]|jgi:glycerol-3-phosphate acyltransferase PlsX